MLIALAWLRGFRNAHREHLPLTNNDLANLPLDWMPEKWERAVFPRGRDGGMHRHHLAVDLGRDFVAEFDGEGGIAAGEVPDAHLLVILSAAKDLKLLRFLPDMKKRPLFFTKRQIAFPRVFGRVIPKG